MKGGKAWLMLGVLGLLFGFGVFVLVELGLESGDVHPPYSTLRSDPRGSRALWDAFEAAGYTVGRNYLAYDRLPLPPGVTLFIVGATAPIVRGEEELAALLAQVEEGARLVVAYDGSSYTEGWRAVLQGPGRALRPDPEEADSSGDEPEPGTETGETGAETLETGVLQDAVGLRLERADDGRANGTAARLSEAPSVLPETWLHRNDLRLVAEDESWRALYAQRDRPVLMRRRWGDGELVFLTESHLFSNEALRFRREAALLTWLAGDGSNLVFDETVHGAFQSPGVGTLLRRYGLNGVFLGGLVLAGLYLWRSATSLLPPREDTRAGTVEGRTVEAGYVSLLQRTLPPGRLTRVALESWAASPAARRLPETRRQRLLEEAEKILEEAGSSPSRLREAWSRLCQSIQTKDL